MARFTAILYAKTEQEYLALWSRIRLDYADHPHLVTYLRKKLNKKKECCKAWTSQYIYYSNVVASKLEVSYGLVNKFLRHSRGDLLPVTYNIERYVKGTIATIRQRMALDRQAPPRGTRCHKLTWVYEDLNDFIVPKAIEILIAQWRIV